MFVLVEPQRREERVGRGNLCLKERKKEGFPNIRLCGMVGSLSQEHILSTVARLILYRYRYLQCTKKSDPPISAYR